jgi:uncharacterized membrane protein
MYASGIVPTIEGYHVSDLIRMGLAWALIIAGALSIVFIFVGGISFILSGGQEEKIKQAVSTIRYSIIGLVVTILAMTIVTIVGRIFNIQFILISFTDVIETVQNITSGFSN